MRFTIACTGFDAKQQIFSIRNQLEMPAAIAGITRIIDESGKVIPSKVQSQGLLDRHSCIRSTAGGVKAAPLAKTIRAAALQPDHAIALMDTMEGLKVARALGANSILMINEYEQGRRLALYAPSGGIVSLKELPDAIRLVAENAKARLISQRRR